MTVARSSNEIFLGVTKLQTGVGNHTSAFFNNTTGVFSRWFLEDRKWAEVSVIHLRNVFVIQTGQFTHLVTKIWFDFLVTLILPVWVSVHVYVCRCWLREGLQYMKPVWSSIQVYTNPVKSNRIKPNQIESGWIKSNHVLNQLNHIGFSWSKETIFCHSCECSPKVSG